MEKTNKLVLFIADDEPSAIRKIKDVLDDDQCVLKDSYKTVTAYFVQRIPDDIDIYSDEHIATHVIRKADVIDIALVDLVFEDEFGRSSLDGAEVVISHLLYKFPYCPVGIVSNNAGGIFTNIKIGINGVDYPCIAKKPKIVDIKVFNTFFEGLLNKWLIAKLSQIDRANKTNELLGLLANPQESLDSLFSFDGETWRLIDLFFFISRTDKQVVQNKIIEHLVTMPRLRQIKNHQKSLVFYENKNNEWGIPFSILFQSYYFFYSFQPRNTFEGLANVSREYLEKLHEELCVSKTKNPDIDKILSLTKRKLATSIPKDSVVENGVIAHNVVAIFKDKLIKRMIVLNLYCFMGFSGTGIVYLLNKNNDAISNNHTKSISKYLGISIPDQKSTKSDLLIFNFSNADFRRGITKRNLRELEFYERHYDFQFKHCGSYEKKHMKDMLEFLRGNSCDDKKCVICNSIKRNTTFIKDSNTIAL